MLSTLNHELARSIVADHERRITARPSERTVRAPLRRQLGAWMVRTGQRLAPQAPAAPVEANGGLAVCC